MRFVIALLSMMLLSASFGQKPVDSDAKLDLQDVWNRSAKAKLSAAQRVKTLAIGIERELNAKAPAWWQLRVEAALNQRRSSASPRIKCNARIERGGLAGQRHFCLSACSFMGISSPRS
jgi:hypothetical protein